VTKPTEKQSDLAEVKEVYVVFGLFEKLGKDVIYDCETDKTCVG
jgi:hypothetical protein